MANYRKMTRSQPKRTTCKRKGCEQPLKPLHLLCEAHWEEWRAEYQAGYYLAHKEQSKEYQRKYNATYKRKSRGATATPSTRPLIKDTYHRNDLQKMPAEKFARALMQVHSGERKLT